MKVKLSVFAAFYIFVFSLFLGAAAVGNHMVTAFAEAAQQPGRIVIDPGHGGIDGGATSCTGVLESTINLQIGLRLEDVFRMLGKNPIMIRKSDTSIYTEGNTIAAQKLSDLKQRVRIANQNALLISIHQNTFSQPQYTGAQVFYARDPVSRELAQKLQKTLAQSLTPENHRTAKPASGIYLMEHIQCPGILIECGFLSNPEEEANLRDPAYQKKLCCVIAAAAAAIPNES